MLTLQPYLYSEAAFKVVGVRAMSIWWTQGGSNP